jgi:hypothetical protein
MVMERVQVDRRSTPSDDGGATDERNVVKVHDIERPGENGACRSRFDPGMPGDLRDQRREEAKGAFKPMHHDPVVAPLVGHGSYRFQAISVETMHDLDVMTLSNKGARQSADIDPTASEIMGWIKGRDHAEPHQNLPSR